MQRRRTQFEKDFADLHGDTIEMEPAGPSRWAPRRIPASGLTANKLVAVVVLCAWLTALIAASAAGAAFVAFVVWALFR